MTSTRAVAFDPGTGKFVETQTELAAPEGHDLLVEVRAAALNPVDLKARAMLAADDPPRQLGFDACGFVVATGSEVSGFTPGDRVYYAGAITRPGSNATHQLVDARIVARAPETLSDTEAAAMPLTALTAWEALFERMRLAPPGAPAQSERLLVINGAGGVGSLTLQLARLAGISTTATASRDESRNWCLKMGATEVVGHADLSSLPDNSFERIFCCHDTGVYFEEMGRLVAPQGLVCSIVGMPQPQVLMPFFHKSAGFVWEYMFTRSTFATADIARQGAILTELAGLIDAGRIETTGTQVLNGLSTQTLEEAHATMAEGRMIGKLVIAY